MAIIKENKTYTLYYYVYDVIKQKRIRKKKRGFKTLKEAKAYELSLSRESSNVAFYTLYNECLKNSEMQEETKLSKNSMLERYMPSLLTIKYQDVTKQFLVSLRSEIANYNLAPQTKNKMIDIVTQTCRYANQIYDLPDNSKVMKRFRIYKKEFDIWTFDEYFKFEEGLRPTFEDCVPYFRCLFFTGMRKGEARALQVQDLDIENGYITINKSMRKNNSSLKRPKTPSGMRKVKLDINTLNVLKPLKSHEKWLFGDYKPMSRDRIDRAFKYAIEKTGVKKIRIHDLRHSHASYLIMNGANIVAVSKRLGHSSINMTLNTYSHLLEDSENKLVNLLNIPTSSPHVE